MFILYSYDVIVNSSVAQIHAPQTLTYSYELDCNRQTNDEHRSPLLTVLQRFAII